MHNSNFTAPAERHRFFFFSYYQRKEAAGKASSTSHLSVYLQIGVVPGADQVLKKKKEFRTGGKGQEGKKLF